MTGQALIEVTLGHNLLSYREYIVKLTLGLVIVIFYIYLKKT